MQNPIDVLGVHPTGGLLRKDDPRDYKPASPEIGMAPAPFDWQTGKTSKVGQLIQGTGIAIDTTHLLVTNIW